MSYDLSPISVYGSFVTTIVEVFFHVITNIWVSFNLVAFLFSNLNKFKMQCFSWHPVWLFPGRMSLMPPLLDAVEPACGDEQSPLVPGPVRGLIERDPRLHTHCFVCGSGSTCGQTKSPQYPEPTLWGRKKGKTDPGERERETDSLNFIRSISHISQRDDKCWFKCHQIDSHCQWTSSHINNTYEPVHAYTWSPSSPFSRL